MMIKILLYFAALSTILFLPERIWENAHAKGLSFLSYLKSLQGKNPFGREEIEGEKLLNFFPEIEAKLAIGLKTTSIDLPRYKFYTTLILELLQVHRRLGISLKNILPELRQNLIKDLQFEKKMKESITGGNLQFIVIILTTWIFIFLSSSLAELPLNSSLMVIVMIHIVAVILFNFILKEMKNRIFLKFNKTIEGLYLFVSLVEIGLPVSQVLSESKVLEGDLLKHKTFSQIGERLTILVTRWKEMGISPKVESGEVIKELWHLKEVHFLSFLKKIDILKFMILAFFFLPAYFFYLYSIFQFFMET